MNRISNDIDGDCILCNWRRKSKNLYYVNLCGEIREKSAGFSACKIDKMRIQDFFGMSSDSCYLKLVQTLTCENYYDLTQSFYEKNIVTQDFKNLHRYMSIPPSVLLNNLSFSNISLCNWQQTAIKIIKNNFISNNTNSFVFNCLNNESMAMIAELLALKELFFSNRKCFLILPDSNFCNTKFKSMTKKFKSSLNLHNFVKSSLLSWKSSIDITILSYEHFNIFLDQLIYRYGLPNFSVYDIFETQMPIFEEKIWFEHRHEFYQLFKILGSVILYNVDSILQQENTYYLENLSIKLQTIQKYQDLLNRRRTQIVILNNEYRFNDVLSKIFNEYICINDSDNHKNLSCILFTDNFICKVYRNYSSVTDKENKFFDSIQKLDFPVIHIDIDEITNSLISANLDSISQNFDIFNLILKEYVYQNKKIFVYCSTRQWCENLAQKVSKYDFLYNDLDSDGIRELDKLNRDLRYYIENYGIAYYHAGLQNCERDIIEKFFFLGKLKIVFSNSCFRNNDNLKPEVLIFKAEPTNTFIYDKLLKLNDKLQNLDLYYFMNHQDAKNLKDSQLSKINILDVVFKIAEKTKTRIFSRFISIIYEYLCIVGNTTLYDLAQKISNYSLYGVTKLNNYSTEKQKFLNSKIHEVLISFYNYGFINLNEQKNDAVVSLAYRKSVIINFFPLRQTDNVFKKIFMPLIREYYNYFNTSPFEINEKINSYLLNSIPNNFYQTLNENITFSGEQKRFKKEQIIIDNQCDKINESLKINKIYISHFGKQLFASSLKINHIITILPLFIRILNFGYTISDDLLFRCMCIQKSNLTNSPKFFKISKFVESILDKMEEGATVFHLLDVHKDSINSLMKLTDKFNKKIDGSNQSTDLIESRLDYILGNYKRLILSLMWRRIEENGYILIKNSTKSMIELENNDNTYKIGIEKDWIIDFVSSNRETAKFLSIFLNRIAINDMVKIFENLSIDDKSFGELTTCEMKRIEHFHNYLPHMTLELAQFLFKNKITSIKVISNMKNYNELADIIKTMYPCSVISENINQHALAVSRDIYLAAKKYMGRKSLEINRFTQNDDLNKTDLSMYSSSFMSLTSPESDHPFT